MACLRHEPHTTGTIFSLAGILLLRKDSFQGFQGTEMVPSTGALTHNDGVLVGEAAWKSSLSQPPFIQNSLHN